MIDVAFTRAGSFNNQLGPDDVDFGTSGGCGGPIGLDFRRQSHTLPRFGCGDGQIHHFRFAGLQNIDCVFKVGTFRMPQCRRQYAAQYHVTRVAGAIIGDAELQLDPAAKLYSRRPGDFQLQFWRTNDGGRANLGR